MELNLRSLTIVPNAHREHFVVCSHCLDEGEHDGHEKDGRIVETPAEARQAEPGPSVLLILIVSVVLALALIVLGTVWFVLFRT